MRHFVRSLPEKRLKQLVELDTERFIDAGRRMFGGRFDSVVNTAAADGRIGAIGEHDLVTALADSLTDKPEAFAALIYRLLTSEEGDELAEKLSVLTEDEAVIWLTAHAEEIAESLLDRDELSTDEYMRLYRQRERRKRTRR